MPLQPNFIERQLINFGIMPWLVIDGGLPQFTMSAVLGAADVGLFEALQDGPASRGELAERCRCARRGVDEVVDVLVHLGYLGEDGDRLSLTTAARRSLPLEDMQRIAPFLREMGKRMVDAGRAIREAPEEGIITWEAVQSGPVAEGYQALMRHLASGLVDDVVGKVKLHDDAERMLDIGGSHGLYTLSMCQKYPRLRGTIIDWPIGLAEAKRTLDEHPGLANRIELVERDFEREDLPTGYDFVFLGQIVHGIDPKGNQKLFGRIARSTRPGAMIGILDQFAGVKGSSFGRAVASLLGFNLFLFSGGRSYAFDRLAGWLADVGFEKAEHKPLRKSPGYSLLLAKKLT